MVLVLRPRFLGLTLLLSLAFFGGGCTNATTSATSNPKLPESSSTAALRAGDSLTIGLQGVPDSSTNSVQVDEQGLITLPFIGAVKAAGSITAGLSQHIRETYIAKKIYTTVDVAVSVTE